MKEPRQGLYIALISIHGLVRGDNWELGRDSDTGGQIKYVREKLDDESFDNFLFDIGTIYHTGWRDLRLGFALQHFGPDMKFINKTFRTPLLFRVGATG